MVTLKRMEKRLETMERWAKELEKGSGPAQTMENMNWLVGQTRMLGEEMQTLKQMTDQLQSAMQRNNEILQVFLDKNDMIRDWQLYLEDIQKEAEEEDAVQEQETESVDARKEAEDGEEVGEEDA